jgi:hypothetical protein
MFAMACDSVEVLNNSQQVGRTAGSELAAIPPQQRLRIRMHQVSLLETGPAGVRHPSFLAGNEKL